MKDNNMNDYDLTMDELDTYNDPDMTVPLDVEISVLPGAGFKATITLETEEVFSVTALNHRAQWFFKVQREDEPRPHLKGQTLRQRILVTTAKEHIGIS